MSAKPEGNCYAVSEAVYHITGGQAGPWRPQTVRHEGGTHWYLKHLQTGIVLDLSAWQFKTPVPYDQGVGRGFLTKQPSKAGMAMIEQMTWKEEI